MRCRRARRPRCSSARRASAPAARATTSRSPSFASSSSPEPAPRSARRRRRRQRARRRTLLQPLRVPLLDLAPVLGGLALAGLVALAARGLALAALRIAAVLGRVDAEPFGGAERAVVRLANGTVGAARRSPRLDRLARSRRRRRRTRRVLLVAARVLRGLRRELGAPSVGACPPRLLVETDLAGAQRIEALAALALGVVDAR